MWEDSQVSPEKDASTDSDSLPESVVDVIPPAEGAAVDPADIPSCAQRGLGEARARWRVMRPGHPRGRTLGSAELPTSLLFL